MLQRLIIKFYSMKNRIISHKKENKILKKRLNLLNNIIYNQNQDKYFEIINQLIIAEKTTHKSKSNIGCNGLDYDLKNIDIITETKQ